MEDFFSEINHGSILITSRLRQLRQHGQDRQFEKMSDLQGTELLRCRIGRSIENNENQATVLIQFNKLYIGLDRIVEKMNDLSLTFAHAGFYTHGTTTSVNDYIRYYEEAWEKLHNNKITRLKDYPRSVLSTYTISYEYVQRNDASGSSVQKSRQDERSRRHVLASISRKRKGLESCRLFTIIADMNPLQIKESSTLLSIESLSVCS